VADRYLLESGAPDGYLLESGSGVLLLEAVAGDVTVSPSGVSSSTAVGSASASGSAVVSATGVASAGNVGAVAVSGAATVSASGVSAAWSVGTVTVTTGSSVSVTVPATGVQSTGSVGSVVIDTGTVTHHVGDGRFRWSSGADVAVSPWVDTESTPAGVIARTRLGYVEVDARVTWGSSSDAVGVEAHGEVGRCRVLTTSAKYDAEVEEVLAALLAA
jgi:hypothetical protein